MPPLRKGRAYLRTDGGARDTDRLVKREVSLVYYPTASYSDRRIDASFILFDNGKKVRMVLRPVEGNGSLRTLADVITDAV